MTLRCWHAQPSDGQLETIQITDSATLPSPQQWTWEYEICCDDENLDALSSDGQISAFAATGLVVDTLSQAPGAEADSSGKRMPVSPCRTVAVYVDVSLSPAWNIPNDGECTIGYEVNHSCGSCRIAANASIRGTNPAPSVISAALGSNLLRAICWGESTWRQFDENGLPVNNDAVDWGFMQINGAAQELKWNWKRNIARGRAILDEKKRYAQAYLKKRGRYTTLMLENEMIQRYNGGTYYKWNAALKRWIVKPPNHYVRNIRQLVKDRPWKTIVAA